MYFFNLPSALGSVSSKTSSHITDVEGEPIPVFPEVDVDVDADADAEPDADTDVEAADVDVAIEFKYPPLNVHEPQ